MLSSLLWIALASAGTQHESAGARDLVPLVFDSEIVRLHVAGDSLEVEGTYVFLRRDSEALEVTLFYPYPADSLLGAARTLLLEGRAPGAEWRALEFEERPALPAVRWRIPLDLGEVIEVRTVYRQSLRSQHARYIVTTTSVWGRPLRAARFEIHLPAGAEPTRFSFPFQRQEHEGRIFYLFEAENFAPDRDVTVEWKL